MGPRRFPGWKRLILESTAMTLVYVAVMLVTGGHVYLAMMAVLGTLVVGRLTRES